MRCSYGFSCRETRNALTHLDLSAESDDFGVAYTYLDGVWWSFAVLSASSSSVSLQSSELTLEGLCAEAGPHSSTERVR